MPISIALFLGIPIGFLFYLEARWLTLRIFRRYGENECKVARLFGVLGLLMVPLIYCFGLLENAIPGKLGEAIAEGFLMVVLGAFTLRIVALLNKGQDEK
jgi:hypothetical protein